MKVAVDPGVNKGHGVAAFSNDGELLWAKLMHHTPTYELEVLAIEIPVVRQTGQQKGRQKDIVDLAYAAGFVVGRSAAKSVVRVLPEEWKGQIPKSVSSARILARLTEKERSQIELPSIKSLHDDVFDAIGIGLHVFSKKRSLRYGQGLPL